MAIRKQGGLHAATALTLLKLALDHALGVASSEDNLK